MAVVRKATDLRLGRTVAVKILRGELTASPSFQERFRREARAVAALNHPAVVAVYDAGSETVDGTDMLYIVMEHVDGHTLRDLLRSGPQSSDHALQVTADVLEALEHSHRRGIVHRDVKPANVMVTPSGAVKVMDFGIARAVADMSAALTQTAGVMGTAQYLSPEQARGDAVDARSDVYSTGCLLYELLSGRPPFEADSAVAVAYQHVRATPRPPSAYAPGVSADIDAVVLAALAKRPDQRYQSAQQMRHAIAAVLAGDRAPVPATRPETTADLPLVIGQIDRQVTLPGPASTDPQAPGRPRRRPHLALAAASALLLLGAGGLTLATIDDDPGTGQQPAQGSVRKAEGNVADRAPGRTETTGQPARPTGETTPSDQRGRPVAGQGAEPATDQDPGRSVGQDGTDTEPTGEPDVPADTPPSASPADPAAPQQTAQPESEPSQTTPSEAPPSDTASDSSAPEPTTSPEPAPTTEESTSNDSASTNTE